MKFICNPNITPTSVQAVNYLGFAFCSLFSGYIVYRSFLPSLKPSLGPIFIAINYFAYAIGSLLPSRIISNHRRMAFGFSSLTYPVWIICLQFYSGIDESMGLNIISGVVSVANGFGAGILWSTKGGWMASLCTNQIENKALFNGIFLSYYGISGLIGNIGVAIAIYYNASVKIITIALSVLSTIGFILLFLTPYFYLHPSLLDENKTNDAPKLTRQRQHDHSIVSELNKWRRITGIIRLFTKTNFHLLLCPIISLGCNAALVWVLLSKIQSDMMYISIAFAIYAFTNCISSFLGGYYMKKRQELILLFYVINTILTTSICILAILVLNNILEWNLILIQTVSISLFGIIIAIYTNIIYSELTLNIVIELKHTCPEVNINSCYSKRGIIKINPLETEPFAMQNFIYCIFYAILTACIPFISQSALIGIVIVLNIFGLISFIIYKSKNTDTNTDTNSTNSFI